MYIGVDIVDIHISHLGQADDPQQRGPPASGSVPRGGRGDHREGHGHGTI